MGCGGEGGEEVRWEREEGRDVLAAGARYFDPEDEEAELGVVGKGVEAAS